MPAQPNPVGTLALPPIKSRSGILALTQSVTASLAYIRTGKLRALAVTTATRSDALPDIPTVSEFVPGYEATGWSGFGSVFNRSHAKKIGLFHVTC
jgi:hypothetical protein